MRCRTVSLAAAAAAMLASAACGGKAGTGGPPGASTSAAGSCTGCHGSAGNAAPPRAVNGDTATTSIAVGAHQAHLLPGPFRKAVSCASCHPVPMTASAPGHDDGKVDVLFGGLATAGGASPAWHRAAAGGAPAASCSATYCHGSTLQGGTHTTPVWTAVVGNPSDPASQVACGTCHGVPPATPGHAGIPAQVPPGPPYAASSLADCSRCHPGTVLPDGSLDIAGEQHIDGVVEIGGAACTRCHGDAAGTRLPASLASAPPRDSAGDTLVAAPGVGAHQVHLTGTSLRALPVACTECHAVPGSLDTHPNPSRIVDISWGPLATAGGAVPTYDRTNPAAPSCAATYCHGATLLGGTVTAPVWNRVDGTQAACGACHGIPPPDGTTHAGMTAATACGACHTGYTSTSVNPATHLDGVVNVGSRTCTTCHGTASRTPAMLAPAPPTATNGSSDTADRGVGAHLTHLLGGAFSPPVACGECHPPVTSTQHSDGVVEVVFGPLARTGLSHPVWSPPASGRACAPGGCSCAASYCHGSTLTGGTVTAPVWTRVDGTQAACGACHGVPPPAPHVARDDCGSCHDGYSSTTVNRALHLNGTLEVTGADCTTCHGDPNRTPAAIAPAPPFATSRSDPSGGSATTLPAVGAHLKHLLPGPDSAGIACSECHVVPTAMNHADGTVNMTFGPLARTGGSAPAFSAGSASCGNVYCHGATLSGGSAKTPVWTRVDGSFSACGACHGIPPPDGTTHAGMTAATACGSCHDGYTPTTVNLALHVNGVIDATGGSCTSCHGDASRILVTGADPQAASAPPRDAVPFTVAAGGADAHLAHLNRGTGAIGAPVACAECHVVPAGGGATATHQNGKADLSFGPLATRGGAAATWNPATLSCAASYCHGNFTVNANSRGNLAAKVTWTQGGPLACSSCHVVNGAGVPAPNDSCHPPNFNHDGGNQCSDCHRNVNAAGTAITKASTHVDGIVSGWCTDCHKSENRVCQ